MAESCLQIGLQRASSPHPDHSMGVLPGWSVDAVLQPPSLVSTITTLQLLSDIQGWSSRFFAFCLPPNLCSGRRKHEDCLSWPCCSCWLSCHWAATWSAPERTTVRQRAKNPWCLLRALKGFRIKSWNKSLREMTLENASNFGCNQKRFKTALHGLAGSVSADSYRWFLHQHLQRRCSL